MIIHTIVPEDRLYDGIEQLQRPEEIHYRGMLMQVDRINHGEVKIVRLISPDPAHYLDPAFAPGQIIRLDGQ